MSLPTAHANPARTAIELAGVRRSFGGPRPALDSIDLSLPSSAYAVVVGPSGCGKTTLLRVIAGLETPDAGRVLIDGVDVASVAPHARGIALAAQGAPLYPHLSVRDNLGFAALARGVPDAEVAARVAAIATAMELSGLLSRRPGELSGGQRQRVALGRALVQQARVTLLDEPLAALEPELRTRIQGLLREEQRGRGSLFLHVTHDHDEAIALADVLVVLHDGRLLQAGAPAELLLEPSTAAVATFLASPALSVIPVTLVDERGGVQIRVGERLLTWATRPEGEGTGGVEAVMMLPRDAAMMVDPAGAAGRSPPVGAVHVQGVVEHAARDRTGTVVTVRLGPDLGGGLIAAHIPHIPHIPRVPPIARAAPSPAVAQSATLALDLSRASFFRATPPGTRIDLGLRDIQPVFGQPDVSRPGEAHGAPERSSS